MKKLLYITSVVIFLLLSSFSCRAFDKSSQSLQTVNGSAHIKILTSMPIEVGDPIELVLLITGNIGANIDYPENKESFSPFLLKGYHVKSKEKDNFIKLEIYYTVNAYSSGKLTFPPLTVLVDRKILKTKPLKITVKSTISNKKNHDINDIKGPLKNNRIFTLIIILVIITTISIFIYFKGSTFLKRKGKHVIEDENSKVTFDPLFSSIIEIYSLKENNKLSIKKRYYILSASLKKILGELINKNLMPLTTKRIKRILNKNLSNEYFEYLAKQLDKNDKVKYSKIALNKIYREKLEKEYPEELNNLLTLMYQLLKIYYQKITEVII